MRAASRRCSRSTGRGRASSPSAAARSWSPRWSTTRSAGAGSAARRARARAARIADVVPLDGPKAQSQLVLLEVDYVEGDPELYVVPLSFVSGDEAQRIEREAPGAVVARLRVRDKGGDVDGLLVDGVAHDTPARLMESIASAPRSSARGASWRRRRCARSRRSRARIRWCRGRASSSRPTRRCSSATRCCSRSTARSSRGRIPSSSSGASSPSAAPRTCRACSPPSSIAGPHDKESATLATVQELVPNEGVAWQSALASLDRYFERVLQERASLPSPPPHAARLAAAADGARAAGADARAARRLHRTGAAARHERTAEMHLLLASEPADPAFAPQPFTGFYQQSLYQGAHKMWVRTVETLRKQLATLPESLQETVRAVCDDEARIDARLRDITDAQARARAHPRARRSAPRAGARHRQRLRHHRLRGRAGAQALRAALQALPARRRRRHDALVPLCVRVGAALGKAAARGRSWRCCRGRAPGRRGCAPPSSREYLKTVGSARFVPADDRESERMLAFYQLEKCIYEIRYELNNRPDWVEIPLSGLRQAMAEEGR